MDSTVVWSGLLAGGLILAERFWAVIERPFSEFMLLGIIPNTDITLSYEQGLMLTLSILLGWLAIEHHSHLGPKKSKRAWRRHIELISL